MKISFVKSIDPVLKQCKKPVVEVGANMHYTVNDAKIAENLFSVGFHTCSGFDLNAGNVNLVGHIKPEGFNQRNFASAFERLVKGFQDRFGEAKALVFGGREVGFQDLYSSATSNEVYSTICDVLSTKCGIPDEKFASVLGKFKDVKTNDDIAIIGDKVLIANKAFEKVGLLGATKDNIEETAEKIYEDVFIPHNFL